MRLDHLLSREYEEGSAAGHGPRGELDAGGREEEVRCIVLKGREAPSGRGAMGV